MKALSIASDVLAILTASLVTVTSFAVHYTTALDPLACFAFPCPLGLFLVICFVVLAWLLERSRAV